MDQATDNLPSEKNKTPDIFDELKMKPVYYSERAIYAFTILFGVLFGSVLMAINFKNTERKKGIELVVEFGVFFTIAQFYVMNYLINTDISTTMGINILGSLVLRYYFWEKYIGKNVDYDNKPVLIPAIIGILVTAFFIVCHLI